MYQRQANTVIFKAEKLELIAKLIKINFSKSRFPPFHGGVFSMRRRILWGRTVRLWESRAIDKHLAHKSISGSSDNQSVSIIFLNLHLRFAYLSVCLSGW